MDEIVRAYCRDYRKAAECEYAHWAKHNSLNGAIRAAALSDFPCGKRHPHQRRIPAAALRRAAHALTSKGVPTGGTFHDLHQAVHATIACIHGIGELTIYDITCRIASYLGLKPKLVYLHAGTRKGARALGFQGSPLHKKDLPRAFQELSPGEIEDCLCIYKDQILR